MKWCALLLVLFILTTIVNGEYALIGCNNADGRVVKLDPRQHFQHPPAPMVYRPIIQDFFTSECGDSINGAYDQIADLYSVPSWGVYTEDFGDAGGVMTVVDINDVSLFYTSLFSDPQWTFQYNYGCDVYAEWIRTKAAEALLSNGFENFQVMETSAIGITFTVYCKTPTTIAQARHCAEVNNEGCNHQQITGFYPCDTTAFINLLQLNNGKSNMFNVFQGQ